ncbi:hypothetical protein AOQ84DRAFT_380396 [Glonium stellatum]|uniref:Mitochondrial ATPase complex subunit ATP10 n=1 Tax=Glonium stellatum TaxID=574774 RepID=A0A8E2EU17_9PEZI|nr:hypothetical protein AOQ84DRAFT_380396 [Glonium stellatum]
MFDRSFLLSFHSMAFGRPKICTLCQWCAFRTSTRVRVRSSRPFSSLQPYRAQEITKGEEEFVPRPLGRPIGFTEPPQLGENTGLDNRSLRQRRDDFVNWDRHLKRRKELAQKMGRPYFRDFTNMKYREGKSFLANPKLFKADVALYFPNLHGRTLASPKASQDTTPVLRGKVSVVNVFSSAWGEAQVNTFTGIKENPELQEILGGNRRVAQRVDINIEENVIKAWIIRLFQYRLRGQRATEDWEKYFIIRKGISESIRETIGLLNGRVGYVYLLDQDCRIRWAASGNAEGDEKVNLTRGLKRLVEELTRRTEK